MSEFPQVWLVFGDEMEFNGGSREAPSQLSHGCGQSE